MKPFRVGRKELHDNSELGSVCRIVWVCERTAKAVLSLQSRSLGSVTCFEEVHKGTKPSKPMSRRVISVSSDLLFAWKFVKCVHWQIEHIDYNGKPKINNQLSLHQTLK